jgi:hypothetical protein
MEFMEIDRGWVCGVLAGQVLLQLEKGKSHPGSSGEGVWHAAFWHLPTEQTIAEGKGASTLHAVHDATVAYGQRQRGAPGVFPTPDWKQVLADLADLGITHGGAREKRVM